LKLDLSLVGEKQQALELAPDFEPLLLEALETMLPSEAGSGALTAFLERAFDEPETLLLVARERGDERVWGLCLVGAFVDPFTAERLPMLLALWVDPGLRHRGVARALQAEARRLLVERGQSSFCTRAAYNDDALVSMAERWGYVRQWEWMLGDL